MPPTPNKRAPKTGAKTGNSYTTEGDILSEGPKGGRKKTKVDLAPAQRKSRTNILPSSVQPKRGRNAKRLPGGL